MKYLKIFENFESDERLDLVQTLDDICLDLSDEGFTIDFHNEWTIDNKYILEICPGLNRYSVADYIDISKEPKFKLSDVEDTITRLRTYLDENSNYFTSIAYVYNYGWVNINDINSSNLTTYFNTYIMKVIIIYNKQ